jgi:diguanylate cyclase (GGDEF)-like protein/PAS domain S-box-containing protein
LHEASQFDEACVRPFYAEVQRIANELSTAYQDEARAADQLSGIEISILLTLAVIAIGATFARTERLNGKMALVQVVRTTEQRLSRIVETNAEGIILFNTDGVITFANSGAETIIGLNHKDLLGRTLRDVVSVTAPANGRPIPYNEGPISQVLRTGAPVRGIEVAITKPHGGSMILLCNVSALVNEQGQATDAVLSFSDISDRKMLEERLTYQASHDPLTQLPNRALFLDRLERALAGASRRGNAVAVLFIDLDNFKFINDSLGHAVGDQLIVATSRRLERCLRAADTVGRFGGDEFTLLIELSGDVSSATILAERVREELLHPFTLGTREVVVSASIGIAVSGLHSQTADELLRNADAAMYAAKNRGKGRFAIFNSSMNGHALRRLEMESDLRAALDRGELVVQYQPSICLTSGRPVGVEALVRWRHPERGLISPIDFVPLAEETSLIVPIGTWVLRRACEQAVAWNSTCQAGAQYTMSVNLSAKQFQHPNLVQEVEQTLRETGLEPHRLILEITESVVMDEGERTISILRDLKSLGVKLAIDDFGTGYSSLSYLKRFPLDAVKVDRSFVDGLDHDAEDSVIVSATISLAHALGLVVIAEGAETIEQVEHLRRMGCDFAQGFYFAKPMDCQDAGEFLSRAWMTFRDERHGRPERPPALPEPFAVLATNYTGGTRNGA